MIEHLPECPSKAIVCEGEYCYCDYAHFCCCDALRACETRVFAFHPEWTMTGLCKPDCASCRRLTELITEWEHGYKKGLDAARDAVEALPEYALRDTCIAAIKREQT